MTFSIRARLLGSLLLAIAVLGTSASVATYQSAKSDINELFDYEMKQMIYTLGMHLSSHPELAQEPLLQVDHDFVTQVWAADGTLLLSAHPGEGPDRLLAPGFSTADGRNGGWRTFTAQAGDYRVQIAQPLAHRRQMAAGIALNAVLPVAAIVPVSGLIIWLGIGYALRPLRKITREVQSRDPGSLTPIVFPTLPSEVAPLVRSLNELMGRLDHALQLERQFIADASHELRTPATALGLQIDLLESARTASEYQEAMCDIRRGIERMQHLIEQILTLACLDPDNAPSLESIDLARFVEESHRDFVHLAVAKSIDFELTIRARPAITGEVSSLRALVRNLVDNALRYTSDGGEVSIVLDAADGKPAITITDSGPGIPELMREKVFARFYSGNGNSDGGGTGLGLAIAKRAAERLGVRMQLHDGPGGHGLLALIEFPVHAVRARRADQTVHAGAPRARAPARIAMRHSSGDPESDAAGKRRDEG